MGPIPLYPVYIRGIAYRAVNRGAEAVSEFQKILRPSRACAQLDHRRMGSSPKSAEAMPCKSTARKPRAADQDFLTLWNDADSDIFILKQAKAECAKLQ